jgi:hypothetical protein
VSKVTRKSFINIILFISFPFLSTLHSFGNQSINDLLSHIERSLKQKDIPAYLDVFSPDIKDQEKISISHKFDQLEFDNITVFRTNSYTETDASTRAYVNVLFENAYAAKIEVWLLDFQYVDGQWKIRKKEVTRDVRNLYKIQIPSGREERVSQVEIKHADLNISFRNPIVFYDNIQDIETALLVLGEGEILFTPSLPRERHQLELVYKTRFLKDRLNYVYLRCSDSLFEKNIRIERKEGRDLPISLTDKKRADSLFNKHYPRSFTIENSLNGELLSFIPQGEEAVIEFEGQKIGKFSYIFSPFSEEEVTLYQWGKGRFINLYSPQADEEERRFFISWGQKFDVKNFKIDIDFEPTDFYISGRAKIDVESRVGYLDEVKFKMNPNLEILRIADENKNELFFTKDKLRKSLYIYFLDSIPQGQTTSIEIFYRGKIEPPQITEDVVSGTQYEQSSRPVWPRYETYLYSLSAYWYPAPPDGDFFTALIKIIIPPEYSVISTGKLVQQARLEQIESVEDLEEVGRTVHIFESQRPVKNLSFIVGKFEKKEEVVEPLPLSYYRTPEIQQPRWELFEESKKILAFYGSKFGPFPFENLSIVHRVWEESGGHSPASFIVLNQLPRVQGGRLVGAETPVNLTRWNEYFLAHELAHQWWGQGVTWDSFHDQWISEGLAQFSTILYLREKYGESAFSNILEKISGWVNKKAKWGPIIFGSRISHFDFIAFQAIIYNKTSLVLNMLRDMLGEDVFFQGIQEFFRRYKYGAARTHDFVNTLSEISKKDLKPFFQDWFESYTLPEVDVSHSVEKGEKGYRLTFDMAQLGDIFLFPLWLEWVEGDNKIKKMIIMDQKKKKFEFEIEQKPKKVRVNPDKAVPGKFR